MVISKNFGHVSDYMRDVLLWLPFPQRITYRVCALVGRCIEKLATPYLRELCCSTSGIHPPVGGPNPAFGSPLAVCRRLLLGSAVLLSVAASTTWNDLPVTLSLVYVRGIVPGDMSLAEMSL